MKNITVHQKMPHIKKGEDVVICDHAKGEREPHWIDPYKLTSKFREQFPTAVGALLCDECILEMLNDQ